MATARHFFRHNSATAFGVIFLKPPFYGLNLLGGVIQLPHEWINKTTHLSSLPACSLERDDLDKTFPSIKRYFAFLNNSAILGYIELKIKKIQLIWKPSLFCFIVFWYDYQQINRLEHWKIFISSISYTETHTCIFIARINTNLLQVSLYVT